MSNAPHYRTQGTTCSSCPFYDSMTEDAGACRVDPANAVVVGMREGIAGGHPMPMVVMVQRQTSSTDWCGRHPGRAVLQWDDTSGFDRIPSYEDATRYAVISVDDEVNVQEA